MIARPVSIRPGRNRFRQLRNVPFLSHSLKDEKPFIDIDLKLKVSIVRDSFERGEGRERSLSQPLPVGLDFLVGAYILDCFE